MRFFHLTPQFYQDYAACTEIEKKEDRPYTMTIVMVNGLYFAIPLRSEIKHDHVVWSNEANKCGLDLSKSVVITNFTKYVDTSKQVIIRGNEFNVLKGKEHFVCQKLGTYIKAYKKALNKQHIWMNRKLCEYSTLQYFHNELGICQEEKVGELPPKAEN
jgi:protein AbiQ